MREGKEEGKREARLNSPELNQQIKVKGARTAAPIIRRPLPSVERAGPNKRATRKPATRRHKIFDQSYTKKNLNVFC